MDIRSRLFIGGNWVDSSDGSVFDVINPADESVITSVASATIQDGQDAIEAAHSAAEEWANRTPRARAEVLRCAFELFHESLEDFIKLISLENGKGYADAKGEALYAAEFFRWYAEEAVRVPGYIGKAPASGARTLVHSKPIGIALLITP